MLPPSSTGKQAFAEKGVRPVAASSSSSSTMRGVESRPGLKRDFSDMVPSTFPTTVTTHTSLSRSSSSETTSSSWDFDFNPGQGNRDHQSVEAEQSTYDDLSPIIPSLSPPPMDERRHSPLLSPVSIQPSKRPAKIVTLNRKNHIQRPQVLLDTLEEDLDTDPIVDFDSDEDNNGGPVTDEVVDEPILNSLAPTAASAVTNTLATSRGRRKKALNSRGRGALLQQPLQQPRHLASPGRQKFHLPQSSTETPGSGPPSPAKPLRPVSELSRILLAPSPASSSKVTGFTTLTPVPPTEAKSAGASPVNLWRTTISERPVTHITTTTASTPKLKLTDIARSLKLPAPVPGIQKPSPSGPKSHRATNEVKDEQNELAMTRYNESDHLSLRTNQTTASDTPGKRKAVDSLDESREASKWNRIKLEQGQVKEGSTPDEVATRQLQSMTPGNASTEYDDTSPIIPLSNQKILSMINDPPPMTQSENSPSDQNDLEDQEHEQQEKERKKKELLLEVYAMRRTLKSSSSEATMPPPFLPPPPPSPSSSLSTGELVSANLAQVSEEERIPIPDDVLEYASKLTPIDRIKWAPVKEGRYHIFALIMAIEPMEVIAAKTSASNHNHGTSSSFQKVLVSVCDQSATSFKVVLWREKANWIYLLKPGDAVLFTDLQMKEFRYKISGNSSSWSKMSRMDGSVLSRYKGSKRNQDDPASAPIESTLRIFMEKRRVLALDLLDPDKGIARAPSCYLSPSMSLFSPPQHPQEQGQQQVWPGTTTAASTSTTKNSAISIPGLPRPIAAPVLTTSIARTSSTKSNTLPGVVSGASIRASVVYRMLIVPNEDNIGWEIGAVMANGRFVIVQSTSKAPAWIHKIVPGKLINFFGNFTKLSDGSVVFSLDGARDPASLSENAWGNSIKQIELKRFRTIRSLREHQFMGDAIVEEATILALRFYNLTSEYNVDDDNQDAMFSFIQCYCKGCSSPTVASPQNPSILFCPHCHLDPQRRQTSTLEWYYPPFEVTLTDRTNHSRLGASLSVEMIQVRCQMELGNQIFPEVPAEEWMTSGDETQFWKCRDQWLLTMKYLNNANSLSDDDHTEGDQTSEHKAREQSGALETIKRRVKVEVRVGLNFVAKGLSIHYL